MQKRNILLLGIGIILLFLIAGCGENVFVAPKEKSAFVGEKFEISVGYDRLFSPFKNIEVVSQCDQINVSAEKIDSSQSGTVTARLQITKSFSQPLKCLQFRSDQYKKSLDFTVTPKKQATLSVTKAETSPIFEKDYTIDLKIDIDKSKRDQEHNFVITFETSSPKVFSGEEGINSFELESVANKDTPQKTPSFEIMMGSTGDAQRTVKLKMNLLEVINGKRYPLDSKTLTFSAHE